MYSTNLSNYYDKLMGDYSSIVTTTQKLVNKYVPPRAHILELGCGTGNILQALGNTYTLSGLDNSTGMLAIARKKVPNASYYLADMSTFTLPQQFDAIICIFDSINHLIRFSQWESLFRQVKRHLKEDGVFIFDINTKRRMERLSSMPPYVSKIDKNTIVCAKVTKTSENIYSGKFQIFEQISKKDVTYIEEIVDESAFAIEKIRRSLETRFKIEKTVDPIRKRISKNTGRVFFVCKIRK